MTRIVAWLLVGLVVGLGVSSGIAQPKLGDALKKAVTKDNPLDLNTAWAEELEALPGVSKGLGKKIVDGRPFVKPDDLVSKKIVSRQVFDRIKDLVSVKP